MSHPETCSLSTFAGIAGFKRSYITQLRKDGRLVLVPGTTQVRVAETLAKLEATRDPSKAGVVARHAKARTEAAAVDAPAAPQAQPEAIADDPDTEGYTYWRERSEKAKALAAERANRIADADLLNAAETAAFVASAITTLRTRIETLPDILGPQLAAITDEAQARATLAEAFEHALEECARQFRDIAAVEVSA